MQPQYNPELAQQYQAQSALQQQGIEAEMGTQAPYMLQNQQTVQAALLEQLNPNRVIEEIKRTLKGQTIDEEGKIIQEGEPLMNDFGIGRIISLLRSVVNINTTISALEENQIKSIAINLMDNVIDDLTLNWRVYGIKNESDRDTVHNIILNMVYPALMRCKRGGERGFLGRTTVESINTAPRFNPQKKEGFWSRFKL